MYVYLSKNSQCRQWFCQGYLTVWFGQSASSSQTLYLKRWYRSPCGFTACAGLWPYCVCRTVASQQPTSPSQKPWSPLLTLTYTKPLCTSSRHLFLGLPCLLLPPEFPMNSVFTMLLSSILARCPSHLSLQLLISWTRSGCVCRSLSSVLVLYLHLSFSFTGPKILLTSVLFYITNVYISWYQGARFLLQESVQDFDVARYYPWF